jgi:hypothetical protein
LISLPRGGVRQEYIGGALAKRTTLSEGSYCNHHTCGGLELIAIVAFATLASKQECLNEKTTSKNPFLEILSKKNENYLIIIDRQINSMPDGKRQDILLLIYSLISLSFFSPLCTALTKVFTELSISTVE